VPLAPEVNAQALADKRACVRAPAGTWVAISTRDAPNAAAWLCRNPPPDQGCDRIAPMKTIDNPAGAMIVPAWK
jgi:hypothetical protein